MDKLSNRYKAEVEAIAYRYTKKQLGTIAVVFYDMTTLYFEAEDEDDLRRIGFSKDGKFQKPQILLGLLVGKQGLPIGYDIFEGNKFEGHTLIPTLNKIQSKYGFTKPVVVADAALFSKENIDALTREGYKFIVGGRIKNESDDIKTKIFERAKGIQDGNSFEIKKGDGTRLIITYSTKRAKKDAANRTKGVRKLRKRIQSGQLTKESINNHGYNKFLTIRGEATISIDEDKIKADEIWDGLKGHITNTHLSPRRVVENYIHLWQIERAFRISKTDLRIRPIYHYQKQRIEAHICIAFVAYTIYKELEYLLKKRGILMSSKRAAELTHNMYELEYNLPPSNVRKRQLLKMDREQQVLYDVIYK
jgi:transposase